MFLDLASELFVRKGMARRSRAVVSAALWEERREHDAL
jgi:hypothetical protein